jgi:hypothetical protein
LTKAEEEIWSKVAQKLLESILKKALNFSNKDSDFSKTTSSSSLILNTKILQNGSELTIKQNLNKYLFDDHVDLFKIISGSNIHHNSTHVNKHGVVIDTDGKVLINR